jgi:hypothetical protein
VSQGKRRRDEKPKPQKKNARFEVLIVRPRAQRLQRLFDLARPRESRAREHPHRRLILLPSLLPLDLDAQIPQLLERSLLRARVVGTRVPRERGDRSQRDALRLGGEDRQRGFGVVERDVGARVVYQRREVVW